MRPTTPEPRYQYNCPGCQTAFKSNEAPELRNEDKYRRKEGGFHLVPLCPSCNAMHPDGLPEEQRVFLYPKSRRDAVGIGE